MSGRNKRQREHPEQAESSAPKRHACAGDGDDDDEEIDSDEAGSDAEGEFTLPSKEAAAAHVQQLSAAVRRRVAALEAVQAAAAEVDSRMRAELAEAADAIERKYAALREPLLLRRAAIVTGDAEPTAEETKDFAAGEEGKEAAKDEAKGVPGFWYRVLSNNMGIRTLAALRETDQKALESLRDIRVTALPRTTDVVDGKNVTTHGFTLTFEFGENEYFTNKELTKTYVLKDADSETGEAVAGFERAEASPINWREGKNLTVRTVRKAVAQKQVRGKPKVPVPKGKKEFKMVEEACESFFSFFKPGAVPKPEEAESMGGERLQEVMEELQRDYEVGSEIRDNICSRAVRWFTGDAIEDPEGSDDEGDEFDMDSDEEDDDDDEPEGDAKAAKGQKPPAETPECKQQ
eukprot:m51a1_g9161 hypothetical protein (405) ;mRNA; r:139831-141287